MSSNTNSVEDIINQLEDKFRLSPYLKLRGTVAFRAAKLAGMVLFKQAKALRDAQAGDAPMSFSEAMRAFDVPYTIDRFNNLTNDQRGEPDEALLMEEMGLEVSDMFSQLKAMVEYSNKLNFDMLELVDPSGKLRMAPGAKFTGVYHSDYTQRASWLSTVMLHAESKDDFEHNTYEAYVASVNDERFTLTKEQWVELNTADTSLFETYAEMIVDLIIGFGDEEREFDDLPVRTQIGLIESLRGKIGAIQTSCIKSVKYMRGTSAEKIAEASKLMGVVAGFDPQFCDMLDSPRYANYAEFMYNYVPKALQAPSAVKSRRVIVKAPPLGRVSDVRAQVENGVAREDLDRSANAPTNSDALWSADTAVCDMADDKL